MLKGSPTPAMYVDPIQDAKFHPEFAYRDFYTAFLLVSKPRKIRERQGRQGAPHQKLQSGSAINMNLKNIILYGFLDIGIELICLSMIRLFLNSARKRILSMHLLKISVFISFFSHLLYEMPYKQRKKKEGSAIS